MSKTDGLIRGMEVSDTGGPISAPRNSDRNLTQIKTSGNENKNIITITALYHNLTHYDTNIKTGNAFLYKNKDKTYLVYYSFII